MKHNVWFSVPERKIQRSPIEFRVWRDGKRHGTLQISNGKVAWFFDGKSWGHSVGWSEIANLLKNNGSKVKRK